MKQLSDAVDRPETASPQSVLSQKRAGYLHRRREYWDSYAATLEKWGGLRGYYHRRLTEIYRFLVPPGARALEIGCGTGDLLAALQPSYGVGIDLSPKMIERAQRKFPHLHFEVQDAHELHLDGQFDYVIASDLVNELWDVQMVLEALAKHVHPTTRLVFNFYSRLWEIPRHIAENLGLAQRQLSQNWLTVEDVVNLLQLTGYEPIRMSHEIMWPVRTPGLDTLANRYLVKLWPFRPFGITNLLVARPKPRSDAGSASGAGPIVSVVVPARNEAGNIGNIFDRVPQMGGGTELIFVEGHSKDDTYGAIEREIARRPGTRAKLFRQTGKGKGDAVRLGFAEATGDVLMILDADLTVPPEDLPRFYAAWREGKGDFINGVRLVYPMEDGAMRFLNLLGNKFFSLAFSWLLGQSIKDTLCGTKVLSRRHYEVIAANRAYFGEIDPFGDFDLIFGAAKYNLKLVDLPVRYQERAYGETNIQRWSHGWILLRMVALALRRIKFV
jgi:SAM-dependent methyltransferase